MLTTPQKDAGALATGIFRNIGEEISNVKRVWLWICHSSSNGVGVAVKNALNEQPNIEVYATPEAIGGIFYFLQHEGLENVQQDTFVQM
jgi:hypothetical protein